MIQNFKYISHVLFLSVAIAVQSGACILDGMNQWRLAQNIACSVGSYCEINIGSLGTGIITPGHYKLCGDINGSGSDVLTITASDVILDLGGYSLNGVTLTILGGVKNVTVRNGIIAGASLAINIFAVGGAQANILIENILVDTAANTPSNPTLLAGGNITGLTIRNFAVYKGSFTNILLTNGLGSYDGVVLENISCLNTNPAFEVVGNEGQPVISLQSCHNLVLKNITLIDQWQELNGILLDSCVDVVVDGVSITSQLATPVTSTTAYSLTSSTNVTQKNVFVDGGTNKVFNTGFLIDSNSSAITMDSCEAYSCSFDGFNIESADTLFENCIAQNNTNFGFIVAAGTIFRLINCTAQLNGPAGFVIASPSELDNCIALSNGGNGFNVGGSSVIFTSCSAISNTGIGFRILGSGNTLQGCNTNNNTGNGITVTGNRTYIQNCDVLSNTGNGIDITVTGTNGSGNGCLVEDSNISNNTGVGIIVRDIVATADFNITCTGLVGNFVITQSRGVMIVRNTAVGNGGFGNIGMQGTATDTSIHGCMNTLPFSLPIVPPIGILNAISNLIVQGPLSTTGASGIFGAQASANGVVIPGALVAAHDGNLVD